jgi:formylmethanofuran dehydrogenase subunit B
MTESLLATEGGAVRWTCPFCLLLCDNLSVRASATTTLELADGECASARIGLAQFSGTPSAATSVVDGQAVDLADAVAAASHILAASRQPLFGGLGTDVAGARAVYRLACETGAICDPAGGEALMHTVRSLQDRGAFTTTLAEVRTRADLIVCLGELPGGEAAEFFARCGLGEEGLVPQRHVVLLGDGASDPAALAALASHGGVTTESVPLHGDLFSTVALLSALLARRAVRDVPSLLAALAERLLAARYAVIVGQTGRLPAQGALIIEGVHRIVGTLNTTTRAAAMWLGGGNGAGTVNQVFTWLSGLPLRSRAGPAGLEHEPLCFDAVRLLADAAVDSLLWISSFDGTCAPPAAQAPLVVLGHPALAPSAARVGSVFIPVSTPGIGSAGHLFRADGGAVLPLVPVYRDTLPTVADVVGSIAQGVSALRVKASP